MDNLKYIMLDFGGSPVPVIFPSMLQHTDVANGNKVLSAGFVQLHGSNAPNPGSCILENAVEVCVFGESRSLKVKSLPEDNEIIRREINRWMR